MTPGRDATNDIRAAERARLQALVEPDLDLADAVHAQDYQLITPGGAVLSKQDYLGAVAAGELDYRTFEAVSDVAVRAGESFGVVRYRARIEVWVSGSWTKGPSGTPTPTSSATQPGRRSGRRRRGSGTRRASLELDAGWFVHQVTGSPLRRVTDGPGPRSPHGPQPGPKTS